MNEENKARLSPELVYEFIKDIRDPERDCTIEELGIIDENMIHIDDYRKDSAIVKIIWTPTSPNCSFAVNIGLCIRYKLELEVKNYNISVNKTRNFKSKLLYKLDILVKEGSHVTEKEINKQVNDKERYLAALECPDIFKYVNRLII